MAPAIDPAEGVFAVSRRSITLIDVRQPANESLPLRSKFIHASWFLRTSAGHEEAFAGRLFKTIAVEDRMERFGAQLTGTTSQLLPAGMTRVRG